MLIFDFPPHEMAIFNHLLTNTVETDQALRQANLTVDDFTTRASKALFHNLWPELFRLRLHGGNAEHLRHHALVALRGQIHRSITSEDLDRLNVPPAMPIADAISRVKQPHIAKLPLPLGFTTPDFAPSPRNERPATISNRPAPASPRSAPVSEQDQAQHPTQPVAQPLSIARHPQHNPSHPSHPSHRPNTAASAPAQNPQAPHAAAPTTSNKPAGVRLALSSPPALRGGEDQRRGGATKDTAPSQKAEDSGESGNQKQETRNQKLQLRNPASSPKKKPRPDDVLGNLPESDQEQVLAWLQEMSYREAAKQIAKPRPEGLALKVYPNSLRQFHKKCLRQDSELDPRMFAAVPDVASDPTFALICHKLEEDILIGLDRFEGRDETMKLLAIYLRYRALQQKNARGSWRNKFRRQYDAHNLGLGVEDLSQNQPAAQDSNFPESAAAPSSSDFAPSFAQDPAQPETTTQEAGTERTSPPEAAALPASILPMPPRRTAPPNNPEQAFPANEQHFAQPSPCIRPGAFAPQQSGEPETERSSLGFQP